MMAVVNEKSLIMKGDKNKHLKKKVILCSSFHS